MNICTTTKGNIFKEIEKMQFQFNLKENIPRCITVDRCKNVCVCVAVKLFIGNICKLYENIKGLKTILIMSFSNM